VTWQVRFQPFVLDEDLPAIDREARKKLTTDPEAYGEPLRKELFGYWNLRAGEYP
jgi:hypothetical protein